MRIFVTSLLAFLISWFAGQLVAQILAEATNATEEYIVVFMAVFLFAFIFTIVFFIAQFRSDPARAANTAARWSLAAFAVLLIGLVAMIFWVDPGFKGASQDLPIIAGMVLPGVAVILVQWLFVRWRVGRTPPRFGRPA